MHNSVHTKEIRSRTYIAIGKVLRAWGLKGMVKIQSYAESPERFLQISELHVDGKEDTIVLSLERVRKHKKAVLLKFKGHDRLEDVEGLVGKTLYLEKEDLPPLEEDEYYWYQLIGMEVWTDGGKWVGRLEEILDTGSHDVYVVRQGERETLIPAVRDVIQKVDLAGRRITIHAIEGLLSEDDL